MARKTCDQIRAVDKSRIHSKADQLSTSDMDLLEESLRQVFVL